MQKHDVLQADIKILTEKSWVVQITIFLFLVKKLERNVSMPRNLAWPAFCIENNIG